MCFMYGKETVCDCLQEFIQDDFSFFEKYIVRLIPKRKFNLYGGKIILSHVRDVRVQMTGKMGVGKVE